MLLRPRQVEFVDKAVSALSARGNTLGVAPTGAGKTVMLSKVVDRFLDPGSTPKSGPATALILQHRDELVTQNRDTYHKVNGTGRPSGVVNAVSKEFDKPITFAMVQTLCREANLDRLNGCDLLVIDEAHHTAAKSYQNVVERMRENNPDIAIFGVTATPNRGDKKALLNVFDNCCDQIMLTEMIATGLLVPPRTFVIDLGVQEELREVKKTITDFDMSEVETIMDHQVLNEKVVEEWKKVAGDRQTVVFCSTVKHAIHVLEAFALAGVGVDMVTADTPREAREDMLRDFDQSKFQVIVNVAVLTEGWDCQPVQCVILLRPCSYKSTMIQMIGRGLRRLDPERYPKAPPKTDCLVLDFGTSVLTHGSLEQQVTLDPQKGTAEPKTCPECKAAVPAYTSECPFCNHIFTPDEVTSLETDGVEEGKNALEDFILTEVDLLDQSPFRWEEIFEGQVMVATAFDAWAMSVFYAGRWHALGGARGRKMQHLQSGEKMLCLSSADDFLRLNGDTDAASKSRSWLRMRPTEKQQHYLKGMDLWGGKLTRYQAACHLTWGFNEKGVQARLQQVC